jgi:peptidoglycan hydrolase-like protein with peptidoglycan-binding domain
MATTTTLRNGSSGSDVKKLQKTLQSLGYDVGKTGADGIYGSKTAAAVKQYQKDNGLAVDGIAGKNTLGSLYSTTPAKSSSSSSSSSSNTAKTSTATAAKTTGTTKATKNKTAATNTAKSNPTKGTAKDTKASAPAAVAPATADSFTYPEFQYDKEFTYDDFSYGDFSYGSYTESDVVKQANALLQQQINSKPGEYQSQWMDEINDYMNKIQNRDPFSYDFNTDALYQQYKDNYIQQGQMAMMDTMGQAAAMTGGYGNSFAQTAGQQAYNQQLNQLNNVIPELYQQAHNRYAYEGQQLNDSLNMYMGLENQDYNRYQTDLGNWYNELEYLTNRYESERSQDYNRWEAGRQQAYDQYSADRSLAYDAWSDGRAQAFDEYTADKTQAYNEYLTGRQEAYDDYSAGQDRAWEEYLINEEAKREQEAEAKKKDQAAAELMASTGNYDRLKEVYGLSDAEVQALKDATAPKSTGGTPTKKYKTLTLTDLDTMQKDIAKAGSTAELATLANAYVSMGYNPDDIANLTNGKNLELRQSNVVDTGVTATGSASGTNALKGRDKTDLYFKNGIQYYVK